MRGKVKGNATLPRVPEAGELEQFRKHRWVELPLVLSQGGVLVNGEALGANLKSMQPVLMGVWCHDLVFAKWAEGLLQRIPGGLGNVYE
jgi:hypothetical protein